MERVRPSEFAHVVYRTRRFAEMLDWYRLVFDARVQFENPALAFLTYDDEHHRFAFANLDLLQPGGGKADERGMIGVDHVAYTFASLTDLLENYATLRQEGVLPYWCVHHGITASLYYADPDGNQMEFQVDSFETSDEAPNPVPSKAMLRTLGHDVGERHAHDQPQTTLVRVNTGISTEGVAAFPLQYVAAERTLYLRLQTKELLAGLGQCLGVHIRGEPDLFDRAETARQTEVSGFVDRPHAALAYQAQDFVSLSQPRTGIQALVHRSRSKKGSLN